MNIAEKSLAQFSQAVNALSMSPLDGDVLEKLDNSIKVLVSQMSGGMSPMQSLVAYTDWLSHLAISPGRCIYLLKRFAEEWLKLFDLGLCSKNNEADYKRDSSFNSDAWDRAPFRFLAQINVSGKDLLREAATDVKGVDPENAELVKFLNNQLMEMFSPANFLLSNPDVLKTTVEQKGKNLLNGGKLFAQDLVKKVAPNLFPAQNDYKVGGNLAITEGKVVFQNDLIELIQYSPTTEEVGKEPVLIVPAWIMKYYILDLSPQNSMVKYLVDSGKTVFMISWKNPTREDRETTLEDYLTQGLFPAIKAVKAVIPRTRINAVGYCIGGTLLSIGAATLARDDDNSLNSVTLFAAQVDFTEPGEIKRFLGTSQMAFLEAAMAAKGVLTAENMGGAFAAMRARDLIWGPKVDRYLLGKEAKLNDLMAWNYDGTRMPYRMHLRYIQELFIENRLAESRFEVGGKPISLLDLRVPMFVVGTTTDHVAPWKSVYKINRLTNAEVTFLLTSGGHNAGIVSGPSHPRRRYQMATRKSEDKFIVPDQWAEDVEVQQGSWWPAWLEWVDAHTSKTVEPPAMGAAQKGYKILRDAPGEYVYG